MSEEDQQPAIEVDAISESAKSIGETATEQSELIRLPLWKTCVEQMLAEGVTYGSTYSVEYFEERLRCKRDDIAFGFAISDVRRALESHGLYLSGKGLKGKSFVILQPADNVDMLRSYSHAATDALTRGVILGTNTRLDTLSREEKRRHESMLEKIAMQLCFAKKPKTVALIIAAHKPELLNGKAEDERNEKA